MWTLLISLLFASTPTTDGERQEALASAYDTWDWRFPKVDDIGVDQLQQLLRAEQPPVLVDVRPPEERRVSTLPDAISLEEYEARAAELAGRQVVTYCTVGIRSGRAANGLRRDGVDVLNFRGSILAWTHAGLPLVDPNGEPTRQVHVYSPRWDFAATAYESVVTERDGTVRILD